MPAPSSVTRWSPLAQKYGPRRGVPANVLLGLIQEETGGKTGLTSPAGAQGLTQFEPGTAQQYHVNVNDPASAVRGAAQYLHDLGYSRNPTKALASYNAGPGNWQAGLGYAHAVLGAASGYKGLGTPPASYTPTSVAPGPPSPVASQALAQVLSRPQGGVSPPTAPAFSAKVQTPQTYQPPPGVTNTNTGQNDLRSSLAEILRADTTTGAQTPLPAAQPYNPDKPASQLAAPPRGGAVQVSGPGKITTTYGGVTEVIPNVMTTVPQLKQRSDATKLQGLAAFGGKPVAAWIAPVLEYAQRHGWQGSVSEGYRTDRQQAGIYNSGTRPAAKPRSQGGGGSNHEFQAFPGGAVDVTNAAQLSSILQRSPYANLLVWAGSKDKVHFSHPHNGSY